MKLVTMGTRRDGYHWHIVVDLHSGQPIQADFGHEWHGGGHSGVPRIHVHKWTQDELLDVARAQGLNATNAARFARQFDGHLSGIGTYPAQPGMDEFDAEAEERRLHPEMRPASLRQ